MKPTPYVGEFEYSVLLAVLHMDGGDDAYAVPVRALLENMGHPQRAYPCIHIAGTNGKGSVSAMIAAVLRHAGLRTGCLDRVDCRRRR